MPGLGRLRLPVRPAWLGLILVGGTAGTAVRGWLEGSFAAAAGIGLALLAYLGYALARPERF